MAILGGARSALRTSAEGRGVEGQARVCPGAPPQGAKRALSRGWANLVLPSVSHEHKGFPGAANAAASRRPGVSDETLVNVRRNPQRPGRGGRCLLKTVVPGSSVVLLPRSKLYRAPQWRNPVGLQRMDSPVETTGLSYHRWSTPLGSSVTGTSPGLLTFDLNWFF